MNPLSRTFAFLFVLMLAIAGCGGGGGAATPDNDDIPVVLTPMSAATVIDVSYTVIAEEDVPATGTTITTPNATLVVPDGAVSTATRIEMLRVDRPFQANPYADDEPGAISAVPAGKPVDFGPAGLAFDKPVTITIPYDPAALTDTHDQPALAYWTGTKWVLLDSVVDPVAHTLTVRLDSFDGVILKAVVIGTTAAIWTYVAVKWAANDDPITEQKAAQYVTPNDPNVTATAAKTSIGGVQISNKTALAQYLEGLAGGSARLSILGDAGTDRYFAYSAGTGSNWQKPADFLNDYPAGDNYHGDKALGKLTGDCTDVTNATVSMFRALGYKAKGVFGYVVDKKSPHAWAEVIINDVAYIVDERGNIQRMEEAIIAQKLIRPDADDNRNFMWDETGQVPYKANWWENKISAMTLTSGSLGSYRGFAVAKGLTDFGKISLDADGKFSVSIAQAEKLFLLWPDIQTTATMTDLAMSGQWNESAKTGTVNLTANEHIVMIDWGQGNDGTRDGNYTRITEDYSFVYKTSGTIEQADATMKFLLQTEWTRTGTKTEERVTVVDGQATVIGEPIVTDMGSIRTSSSEFWFTYE